MFRHILVPVEVDAGSRRAIEAAVAPAQRLAARIAGVHAMRGFAHPGIVDELLAPAAAAAKRRGGLIVLAAHGRRGIARLVPGSQTQRARKRARVAVPVVH